jgi:hypothetical protein
VDRAAMSTYIYGTNPPCEIDTEKEKRKRNFRAADPDWPVKVNYICFGWSSHKVTKIDAIHP